jgi:hypothetical protein
VLLYGKVNIGGNLLFFKFLVFYGDVTRKLIIDGGSYMNVVFEATIEKLKLPIEPHLKPYKATSIISITILVTKRCLVSITHDP